MGPLPVTHVATHYNVKARNAHGSRRGLFSWRCGGVTPCIAILTSMAALPITSAAATAELFERAADALFAQRPNREAAVRLGANGRLLATGDLHDNPVHLNKLVRLAKLDEAPSNHLVLHEMIHSERLINGVDLSHRMLARAADLILHYPSQVHVLLANHELSQLTGRGVSKGAGNSVELFDAGLEFAFGDDAEFVSDAIRAFIRAMPVALVSDSGVLCAHSLPGAHAMKHFDLGLLDRPLSDADYDPATGSASLMTWGREHTPELVATLAKAWNVKLFCLGHQHVDTGAEVTHTGVPGVIVLNSDHEFGACLPIDLADVPAADDAVMFVIPLRAVPETA